MVSGLFAILFPPPKYLARPAFGLDISDRSLKYIKLSPGRRHFTVDLFGEKSLPAGLLESGKIKDRLGLTKICRGLRHELKNSYLVVSLPEEHAFIFRVSLPYMKVSEIRTSIELQLEQHVPLKPDSAVFDYEALTVAQEPGQTSDLAVTVFPRSLILDYHQVLTDAGFEPLAYEIEAQAIARSVIQNENTQTVMIIDFGKTRTSFFITNSKKVLFTSTLSSVGGENLTQSVKKNLNLSYG